MGSHFLSQEAASQTGFSKMSFLESQGTVVKLRFCRGECNPSVRSCVSIARNSSKLDILVVLVLLVLMLLVLVVLVLALGLVLVLVLCWCCWCCCCGCAGAGGAGAVAAGAGAGGAGAGAELDWYGVVLEWY